MNELKVKSIEMNERGVLVIPEEIRRDLNLFGRTTLVLIESSGQLILKKQDDVARVLLSDDVWKKMSEESLRNAWGKEDAVWDKIARK
ncbi:MAG: hypothetical protein V1722_03350 [Candidatus Micrarchaeota archaeon]